MDFCPKIGHFHKFQRFSQGMLSKFVKFSVVYIGIFRYTRGTTAPLSKKWELQSTLLYDFTLNTRKGELEHESIYG